MTLNFSRRTILRWVCLSVS